MLAVGRVSSGKTWKGNIVNIFPLPISWQCLLDWCQQRLTESEAYDHADALWKALAVHLLDELQDHEVEALAQQLIAEHGAFQQRGAIRPNITDRHFPYTALSTRLTLIERRRVWREKHEALGKSCRIVDEKRMVALMIYPVEEGKVRWEIIREHLVEDNGLARSELLAWQEACDAWSIIRARLDATAVPSS
jgi:hypothetical protein